jgi:hypothetical protein
LFDSQQRFALDRSFVSNTATGGNITFIPTQSSANLQVTITNNSFAARESRYVFKYQPGKSQLSMLTFVLGPQSSGNVQQRVGYFGSDNGFYLELSDNLYFVKRSNVTGTIVTTRVQQNTWNGDQLLGAGASGYTLDITKAQILFFDMEWLGVGSVRLRICYKRTVYSRTHISTRKTSFRAPTSPRPVYLSDTKLKTLAGVDQPLQI